MWRSVILTTETGREAGRSTGGQEDGTSPGRATPGQAEVTRGDLRRRGAPGPGTSLAGWEGETVEGIREGTREGIREGVTTPLMDMGTPMVMVTPLMDMATRPMDMATPLMVTVTPLTDMGTPLMDMATLPEDTAVRPMDMATPLMDTAILHMDTVTPLMALMDMEEVEEDPAMPGPGNPVQHLELEALTISVRFKVWSKTGPREEEYLAMEDSPSKRDLCSTWLEFLSTSDLSQLASSSSLEASLGLVGARRDTISTDNPTI